MITIWLALIIFTDFILYMIFFDIILSWLSLIWIRFRPKFISSILDPIYNFINNIIPTTIWPFRFDALIIIIFIYFFQGLLLSIIPWLNEEILKVVSSF